MEGELKIGYDFSGEKDKSLISLIRKEGEKYYVDCVKIIDTRNMMN